MTVAQQMLQTTPGDTGYSSEALAACIDACFDCAQACTACADACLGEDMVADMRRCITTDLNCADVCAAAGRNAPGAGRPHELTPEVMEVILFAVSCFQRVEVACELAGVSRKVFYGSLRAAACAEEHLRNGGSESDLTDYDRASMGSFT